MECEFPKENATSQEITEMLHAAKRIAVVGLSPKPDRPSYGIAAYLQAHGYTILPVNPGHPEILGEKSYKSLRDVPGPIDIVNIFRDPAAVPEIVDQAIEKKARAIWMQDGIVHNAAAEKARVAGLQVVMNKCIYREHSRL